MMLHCKLMFLTLWLGESGQNKSCRSCVGWYFSLPGQSVLSESCLYSNSYHPHSCCFPEPEFPLHLWMGFSSVSTSDLSLCKFFFFLLFSSSSQLKQPLSSEKTPRPLFGACRHVPCKACWTLTTYAPGKNPLWQPWSTPSRRLRYFPLN